MPKLVTVFYKDKIEEIHNVTDWRIENGVVEIFTDSKIVVIPIDNIDKVEFETDYDYKDE